VLADEGELERFHGFDGRDALVERLGALQHTRYLNSWSRLLDVGLRDAHVQDVASALLARTVATVGRTDA
jgi:hypothetical protein